MSSIRARISATGIRTTVIVPDTLTIRQTLEDADVNYEVGVTSVDGASLRPGDLDKTFADLGITEKCMILNSVKADNAVSVKVVGGVAVVSSTATYEELTRMGKVHPESLMVVDEDEEPLFVIGTAKTAKGSLDNNAAFFGTAPAADGKATITMDLPNDKVADAKTYLADHYGIALRYLSMIEEDLPQKLAEADAEYKKILDSIEQA